ESRVATANAPRPPPPPRTPAARFLIRPAVSLHHSIDGNLRGGRQFHDRGSLLLGAPLVGGLTPATNTSAPIRHRPRDLFREFPGTPVVRDPTARRFRADCAPLAPVGVQCGRALGPNRSRRP